MAIVITSPTTNTKWIRGNNYTISWAGGDGGIPTVELKLYKGAGSVSYIGTVLNSVGSKDWSITNTIATGTDYRVFIEELVP